MNELLYYAFADLMVRVEYNKEANSLRYASHRKIKFVERTLIEQHMLSNVALKTDYYKKHPSLFIYLGIDNQLVKHLNLFHLKNTLKSMMKKEKEMNASVDGLINQSMENYYFEQIGDTILSMRRGLQDGHAEEVTSLKDKMEKLVKAYNLYSNQEITVKEVVPQELHPVLGISPLTHRHETKI